jgi:hypothetical protein
LSTVLCKFYNIQSPQNSVLIFVHPDKAFPAGFDTSCGGGMVQWTCVPGCLFSARRLHGHCSGGSFFVLPLVSGGGICYNAVGTRFYYKSII